MVPSLPFSMGTRAANISWKGLGLLPRRGYRVTEEWRPIVGYEGHYEVSDHGRVRSLARVVIRSDPRYGPIVQRIDEKIMALHTRNGRKSVYLSKDDKQKRIRIHRLVLETFVGPCPPGMECCHANDIPDDNRLSNLRWDTCSANKDDCVRNGHHHNAVKTHCKRSHELTEANIYVQTKPNGRTSRSCRICAQNRYQAQRNHTHVV